jgi:peptidoglycan/LPS O-acetylase OafA/YrhL
MPLTAPRNTVGSSLLTSINKPSAVDQPATGQTTHLTYRPDIDGLRAVAVLLVLTYHAFPNWLPGGFIGVDVFFVISGYLISSLLFRDINNNSFSFLDFYARRIRRIFPALLMVFVACYVLGWFTLLPHEYKQLGKHIAGGAAFISNFILWNESGYFDNAAITKPLLHLWSLGIEEQFYILWPIVLWASFKKKINWLVLIIFVTILSFFFNYWLVYQDPVATFYSPLTRAWELLLGAAIAHKTCVHFFNSLSSRVATLITAISACSLVSTAYFLTKSASFPGAWALIPTLATVLLISLGVQSRFNQTVLSSRGLVWLGLISFPLYLWHWPLLSFGRILEAEPLGYRALFAIVLASVFLAWVTYRWIETPFRRSPHLSGKAIALLCGLVVIGYLGYNSYSRDGLAFRGPQIVGKDQGYDGGPGLAMAPSCGLPAEISPGFTCWQDNRKTLKFALVGDSKASALHGGLVRTSTEAGRWLFIGMGSKGSPLPIITNDKQYSQYQYGSITAIQALADNKQIDVVVIASATRSLFRLRNATDIEDLDASPNYQAVLDGLQRVIDVLKASKKKILLVVDNPTLPNPEDCLPRITTSTMLNKMLKQTMNQRCHLPLERHLELSTKYRVLLAELAANNQDVVSLFDTIPILCDQTDKVCSTIMNGKLLYSDGDHISDYAAGLIGKELNLYLQNLVR